MRVRLIMMILCAAVSYPESLAPACSRAQAAEATAGLEYTVFVGTYTGAKSKGIYACRFDAGSGELKLMGLAAEAAQPTFLAIHPNQKYLYAANEISDFSGQRTGAVGAFAIDAEKGRLTLLNQQSSGGAGPCHVEVDRTGKYVFAANYGSGSVAAFPLEADGRLKETNAFFQHAGSSVNPQRQTGPHAHCINVDPFNMTVLVCDLGLDKVFRYQFDAKGKGLVRELKPPGPVAAGAGPRHLAFHPSARYLYVINELNSTLSAFRYDHRPAPLKEFQTVSTLPADFKGSSTTAEVEVHPSGHFLYGSNRGHDSIVVCAIDPRTGELKPVQHQSTKGKTPRHFGIDPTGKWLLAANQGSDNLVVFRIDAQSGRLSYQGEVEGIGSPVCVKFVPVK